MLILPLELEKGPKGPEMALLVISGLFWSNSMLIYPLALVQDP